MSEDDYFKKCQLATIQNKRQIGTFASIIQTNLYYLYSNIQLAEVLHNQGI